MDPQAPTSFIPKKPLSDGPQKEYHEPGGLGFLFFIGLFVFLAAIVAAGAVFGYQSYLKSSIAAKADSLAKAEGAFDISTVQDLIRLDARINNARTLLQSHVAPSAVFDFLSQQTLQKVQFTSFDYELQTDNSATITLAGVADSFSTVALQSDQFGASKMLKDVIFSDIKVGVGGSVTFSVSATVDPALINYAKNLGSSASPQAQVQAVPTQQIASSTPTAPVVPPVTPPRTPPQQAPQQ